MLRWNSSSWGESQSCSHDTTEIFLDSFLKCVFESLNGAVLRLGQVIDNISALASGNLIHEFFLALRAVL